MNRTFCIAEAGSCHDGDYEKALRLIQVAKDAGADACKFQFWSSATRLAERRHAPAYEAIYAKYQVPVVWLSWLALACKAAGLEFMCTVYLPEDVVVVDQFVSRHKVASFECGDAGFIASVVARRKPVIVSTGMMRGADKIVWDGRISYLHCISAYPTPPDQANLAVLQDHGYDREPIWQGYSDHTCNALTGAFAVCAGARILEVHFKLDDTDRANPDYATALTPAQLTEYVRLVRLAEVMLGDGIKRPQPAEAEMMRHKVQP